MKQKTSKADDITKSLMSEVDEYIDRRAKANARPRTVRRMVEIKFGDRIKADINRLKLIRSAESPADHKPKSL